MEEKELFRKLCDEYLSNYGIHCVSTHINCENPGVYIYYEELQDVVEAIRQLTELPVHFVKCRRPLF